ncbi:MAG: transposase, partial [Firmicutes bacterium]|nr:transposase [Bacillota bacterium]
AVGKKKRVVYNFIDFVGHEWMKSVKAVACDMNSDFAEAFVERCPHIEIVYDRFHIIKNFNEKVVSEVRKDEYRRLMNEGEVEAARFLKGSKYILTSNRSTLQKKDIEAIEGKVISKGSDLFGTADYIRSEGYEARYDELIRQNHLLFTADLIKNKLEAAYKPENYMNMGTAIAEIVYYCFETKNSHFEWFGRLLWKHHEGIVAYAKHKITSGKIEGINRKIKTLRWKGYGYPDDEYFFLKIMDASRAEYVRNPKSHRILH